MGVLPGFFRDTLVILGAAFIAARQSTIIGKLSDRSINTTMTAVNLNTTATSAYRALIRRERDASRKADALGTVSLAFLLATGCDGRTLSRPHVLVRPLSVLRDRHARAVPCGRGQT